MAARGSGADSGPNQLWLRRWGHLLWAEPIITLPSAATRPAAPLRRLQGVAVEETDTFGDRSFGLQNPDFNIVFALSSPRFLSIDVNVSFSPLPCMLLCKRTSTYLPIFTLDKYWSSFEVLQQLTFFLM